MPQLSFLIPLFNEEDNVDALCAELRDVCGKLNQSYEIIIVDDGSTDRSFEKLQTQAKSDSHLRLVRFRRNFGQTAAVSAGLHHAQGQVIIMLDADLQNDPHDVPALLHKLDEGYDVVSGWRKNRQDAFLSRILPSRIANFIIGCWTGVPLKDYGCTLKAYRREVLQDVRLYGEMHRFLPYYAFLSGAKIVEIAVNHRPRTHGKSKYGISRTVKVLLDMITIRFLGRHAQKPIYLFGGIGSASIALGVVIAAFTVFERIAWNIYVHRNPLILLASLLGLAGLQFMLMGLLAEILMRTYHESQSKPTYLVRETFNFPASHH